MNNEGFRRLMLKERERWEALKAEHIKEESEQITKDISEEQEDKGDAITDRESGDNE